MSKISFARFSNTQAFADFFDFSNTISMALWCRLFIYVIGYVSVLVLQIIQVNFLSPEVWQPVNLIMALAFISQIALVELAEYKNKFNSILQGVYFLDALLLAGFYIFINSNPALFLFLQLVNVGLAGYFFGARFAYMLAFWSGILFNFIFALHPLLDPESLRLTWFVDNSALLLVASLAGALGEQIKSINKDLDTQKEEIKILTNLNDLIVENIPSGLLLVDSQYKVLRANQGAQQIFGDLRLVGLHLSEIFIELQTSLHKFIQKAAPENFQRNEIEYVNHKKEKMILEVIFSSIKTAGSSKKQYLCLLQNLTEIKNLEFAVRQNEKMAAVGQLAAGIAHEIRNPLASISGSVQLLQLNLQTQTTEDKKLLAIVVREIDRLNKLITEFLDFVRPDVKLDDPININVLLHEVLEMVKLNENLSDKVEQRTEFRAQGMVFGHHDKLKQAMLNIIINAYQAMTDTLRPELFIQTYDSENNVVVVIQDNGMGMSPENMQRIFEPFHTTKSQGTGLGLAITHKIIQSHNGKIFVESEFGHGSKFNIILPTETLPDATKMYLKKQA